MKETIGILGGMGPAATIKLFEHIVYMTEAKNDREHIPIFIDNNTQVPDRTASIMAASNAPLPVLVQSARRLQEAGATFIIMPCHTAHFYYDEIVRHIDIPFLHLQEETYRYAVKEFPRLRRFGLLATSGTIKTGLFPKFFSKAGLDIIEPAAEYQEIVMDALYVGECIKSGYTEHPRQLMLQVAEHLKERHAEAIIAGCTEISLLLNEEEHGLPVLDPLKIIAEVAIKKAGYNIKK